MYAPVPALTGDQVLHAFYRDAPSLFFGAVIVAVGLAAAALAAIRRERDPLLIYLAAFAGLYGLRMWIKSDLLSLATHGSWFYPRFRSALDFILPIPAFLFLYAAGFLQRWTRNTIYGVGLVLCLLALATLVVGPRDLFYQINGVLLIAILSFLLLLSTKKNSSTRDFIVMRRGLLIFGTFAVWENLRSVIGLPLPNTEAIGFMVFLGTLGYVAARQTLQRDQQLREIQKELEVARRIQLSILPAGFPISAHFHVAARYVPMTSVAGDFYDYLVADERQAGLLIADVSGHGVPAALIASMVKVAATSQLANVADPSQLLSGMNAVLCGNTQNQFVTAAYVHLNFESREMRYSAAGHPPMLLLRNGKVMEVLENGLILAAFDFATYSNAVHRLESGDRLLLYTDGIVEAANASGEFFGQEALSTMLQNTAGSPPASVVDQIIATVQRWSPRQDDDLTVLVCDYSPAA